MGMDIKRTTATIAAAAAALTIVGCACPSARAIGATQRASWDAMIGPLTEDGLARRVDAGTLSPAEADFIRANEVAEFDRSITELEGGK